MPKIYPPELLNGPRVSPAKKPSVIFPACCRAIVELYGPGFACLSCARAKRLLPAESSILRRSDFAEVSLDARPRHLRGQASLDLLLVVVFILFILGVGAVVWSHQP